MSIIVTVSQDQIIYHNEDCRARLKDGYLEIDTMEGDVCTVIAQYAPGGWLSWRKQMARPQLEEAG